MKRLLHTPLALLLRRIVLLYAVLMLCRAVFYLYNAQLLGTIGRGELWQLLAGSLKFDTVSVIYANGVFILLALLPLHVRERGWYRKLMYWYYVAVNASISVTRKNASRPTRYSSPTTAIRYSSSVSSWPKTGTWYSSPQPS